MEKLWNHVYAAACLIVSADLAMPTDWPNALDLLPLTDEQRAKVRTAVLSIVGIATWVKLHKNLTAEPPASPGAGK